jgi:hypothetical protein
MQFDVFMMLNCIYAENEISVAKDARIAEKARASSNPAHNPDAAPDLD